VTYQRVGQALDQMRGRLAAAAPIILGISVDEPLGLQPVATSGIVPMSASSEKLLGGPAVLAVGYHDAS
jgi:hypothetical protein